MAIYMQRLNLWRENAFFFSLIFTVAIFPFSEALVSISSGLLFIQSIVFRSWLHPSSKKESIVSLLFLLSIFGVYILGVIFTNDFSFALYELRKVIFWIVIPLAFFLSPRLPDHKIYLVLKIFIIAVTVSALIFTFKILLHKYFQVEGVRSIGFISHIRFSFQVVLSLIILAWFFIRRKSLRIEKGQILIIGLILFLTYFLFLLQSLLGIIAFIGTIGVSVVYYLSNIKGKGIRILFAVVLLFLISVPVWFVSDVIIDYYDYEEIDPLRIEHLTPSGNIYEFDFDNKARENGNLVYIYICHDELRQEWNKRNTIKYDDTLNSYPLSITLIRYLSSLGLRKDSAAIAGLTNKDIELIERGVTNCKFKNRFFSIYPRVYETVWEVDNFIRSGDPNNKSLAQRIEFVKASLVIIGERPWFGVGTGNWVLKYNEVYDKMNSRLDKDKRASSHNQYLNYMVKFGIIGFLWILIAILVPVFREGQQKNFVFILFLVSMALANFGDANFETHMGLSFFTFFYCLFLWHSGSLMRKSIRS
jgi:hypothetical protein